MKKRSATDWIQLFFKGAGMGAADVVPGVSGGTVAFISGIYEELIGTLSNISVSAIQVLFKKGLVEFWKKINGTFLLVLFAGILTSIFSLAKLIHWLLENEPIRLWAFFFGLVIASIWMVGKAIKKWKWSLRLAIFIAATVAFFVTTLPPISPEKTWWFMFFSGFIAICAMILPGISGSFILLILGSYPIIIAAIKDFVVVDLLIFGTGCILGLVTFSKGLKWMFKEYEQMTIAVLTGFLVGSLNKLWPWKEKAQALYTHSNGEVDYLEVNINPTQLSDPDFLVVAICTISGAVLILGLEWFGSKLKAKKDA